MAVQYSGVSGNIAFKLPILSRRVDLQPLVTRRFKLDQIEEAYDLFANQRDGVLKVANTP